MRMSAYVGYTMNRKQFTVIDWLPCISFHEFAEKCQITFDLDIKEVPRQSRKVHFIDLRNIQFPKKASGQKILIKGQRNGLTTMEELSKKTGKELSAGFNSLYPHQKKIFEELYGALSEEERKISLEKALSGTNASSLHVDDIDDNNVDK